MTLTRAFIYLISSIFMFLAGNMQNWLAPWLETIGMPDWITKSPAPIAFLFVFATLVNMWFVGKFTPKEPNKLAENEKKKIVRREGSKHKRAVDSLQKKHKKEVEAECNAVRRELGARISSLNEECSRKQITIDVLSAELTKARQEQSSSPHANVKKPSSGHIETGRHQPQIPDLFATLKENS
ncbi:hypothetical protein ACI1HC_004733 [Escherichia coli]|nr:hypothetical protein [Escherichia coli]ELN6857071.1 hypothetical protein [Escherichia coli]HBB4006041.1 hypothetical protein [Escherichia coli]